LIHSLHDFEDARAGSPWKLPAYTIAVAASSWARGTYISAIYENKNDTAIIKDTIYQPESEIIYSHRNALRASGWLYFILAILPIVITIAFVLTILLRSTPVGKDFGLISILAGVNPDTLPLLRGAERSEPLKRPTTLTISAPGGQTVYSLSIENHEERRLWPWQKV
jgi:hypothetical protein